MIALTATRLFNSLFRELNGIFLVQTVFSHVRNNFLNRTIITEKLAVLINLQL